MRTSATGAEPAGPQRTSERGFTLVELMVVIVIIGLAASIVVMTVPPPGPNLAAIADQFGSRLMRAKEEAVLTNRPIAVALSAEGYAFRARTPAGWRPMDEKPFQAVAWGEDIGVDLADAAEVRFEPTGQADPVAVTLSRRAQRMRVVVDVAGNVRVEGAGR